MASSVAWICDCGIDGESTTTFGPKAGGAAAAGPDPASATASATSGAASTSADFLMAAYLLIVLWAKCDDIASRSRPAMIFSPRMGHRGRDMRFEINLPRRRAWAR